MGSSGDDDEAAMAAMNCIDSINVLLDALPDDKPMLVRSMEPQILPLVEAVLNPSGQGMEYLENVLETISFLTFRGEAPFSPQLWNVFPMIYACFDKYAYDYIHEIVSPYDNYISLDTDTFVQGQVNGVSYVEIVIRVVQKIFELGEKANDLDTIAASRLYLSLLHNCHGKIDNYVPIIMQGTLNRMQIAMSPSLSRAMLEVIESAIIYNASAALQYLQSKDALQFFITLLFQQLANHETQRSKKICCLSFLSMLNVTPRNQLPQLIQDGYTQIIIKCVEMIYNLTRQIEEEGDEDGSSSDSDSDDSDDSDDDDMDDSDGDDDDDDDDDDVEEDDGDIVNQDDDEYMKMLNEMQQEANQTTDVWDQGDMEDYEDKYTSRLDEISVLETYVSVFRQLPQQVVQSLNPQIQQECQKLVVKAQEEAEKAKKAAEDAANKN